MIKPAMDIQIDHGNPSYQNHMAASKLICNWNKLVVDTGCNIKEAVRITGVDMQGEAEHIAMMALSLVAPSIIAFRRMGKPPTIKMGLSSFALVSLLVRQCASEKRAPNIELGPSLELLYFDGGWAQIALFAANLIFLKAPNKEARRFKCVAGS